VLADDALDCCGDRLRVKGSFGDGEIAARVKIG
jgi:hypothetical protein